VDELQPGDRPLTSALRAVAAEDRSRGASAAVEARLLAEVRSIAHARRIRTGVGLLAAAAVWFIAMAVPAWRASNHEAAIHEATSVESNRATGIAETNTREVTTDFFPLTYSSVPAPGGQLVRMQVPRTALARFGVTSFVVAGDRSSTVLAEVVVGNDGLARAVRFVRVAGISEQQEQKQ